MRELPLDVDTVARVAHEGIRALAEAQGLVDPPLAWRFATAWERGAIASEVVLALEGMDAATRWEDFRRDRLTHGWRHGEVLHGGRKTDPRLVEHYQDQPAFYRQRGLIIDGLVAALLSELR